MLLQDEEYDVLGVSYFPSPKLFLAIFTGYNS